MKLTNIYIASWAPSSTLHLKEYYRALAGWESVYFKRREIRAWLKDMQIRSIDYSPESINVIQGQFENRLFFRVSEDGLIILSQPIADPEKDAQRLEQFLNKKMINLWDNLFSRGATRPKVFDEIESRHPLLLTVSKATGAEMENFFEIFKTIPHKKIHLEQGEVWIGENLAVINSSKFNQGVLDKAVERLLFARVYEIQLERFVRGYEVLWNKVEGIRNQKYFQQQDLPIIHDRILNIQNQANFFQARLNQMRHFLDWRGKLIDEYVLDGNLNETFKRIFMSLHSSQKYLQELWAMLANYINSTVSLINFLYSDSEHKNLANLQKLFLVSTVAAIISLGGLLMVDVYRVLVFGGLAIAISVLVYFLLFRILARYKKISIFQKDIELPSD